MLEVKLGRWLLSTLVSRELVQYLKEKNNLHESVFITNGEDKGWMKGQQNF